MSAVRVPHQVTMTLMVDDDHAIIHSVTLDDQPIGWLVLIRGLRKSNRYQRVAAVAPDERVLGRFRHREHASRVLVEAAEQAKETRP